MKNFAKLLCLVLCLTLVLTAASVAMAESGARMNWRILARSPCMPRH